MSPDTFVWSETRDNAIDRFHGQTPSAQIEQEILERFEHHPRRVVSEIDRVAGKLEAGKITSAWPILRMNLADLEQRRDAIVSDTAERDRKVRVAEIWIRNAGCHFDRETELLDELFGHTGPLRDWASDDVLRQRLVALWRLERPRGELTEAEFERRAVEQVLLRKRLNAPAPKEPV